MIAVPTTSAAPILVTLSTSDAPISHVTVFKSNRAEITRNLRFVPEVTGIHEIKICGLPGTIDSDSVRVDGIGYISILDVSNSKENGFSPETIGKNNSRGSAREKELSEEFYELETILEKINCEERRGQIQEASIKQYVNTAMSDKDSNIDIIDNVLTYSMKRLESIDSNRALLKRKFIETQKKVDGIKSEFLEVQHKFDFSTSSAHLVTATINVLELGSIDLTIRYVVSKANWSSSFDMRVTTTTNSIRCLYYGQVQQSTGEDWDEVSLTLSTVEPSTSARPPQIFSKTVGWKEVHAPFQYPPQQGALFGASKFGFGGTSTVFQESEKLTHAPLAQRGEVAVDAGGSSTLGAISYPIDAPVTISSKALPKKIIIGALDLSAEFAHFAVPSKEDAAYLKAKVHNTTEYLLLASNDVSMFFDKRFVSKTYLCSVSPGEKFDLFLGVDKAIKVTYAPPRKMSKTRGLLTKSQYETHMLCSTITNSKDVPITIAVIDVLPQSTDDLIKVTLENPPADMVGILNTGDSEESLVTSTIELIEGFEPPTLPTFSIIKVARNESGKMVWIVYIAPKAVARIPFEFTMEWPSTREIEIN